MTDEPGERLSERRNYVLVLSLLVDQQHQLIQGELTDPNTDKRMRFKSWHGLLKMLRAWILAIDADDQHSFS